MKKKILGLSVLLIAYTFAAIIGILLFNLFKNNLNIYLNILLCNIISTAIIWLIGVIFKTASMYDPYWSVQTIVIYVGLMFYYNSFNIGVIIYLLPLAFWAIRLTYNFIRSFYDLSYIDWRYKMLKEKTKGLYQIVNLLGICMFPTIIVHIASIPMYVYIIENIKFNYFAIIGIIIMIIATIIELIADSNMRSFKKQRTDNKEIIRIGLWKYSRHPNYLGEISFWYGVIITLLICDISYGYLIIGAFLITLLFLFISIPMAENNLKKYKNNFDAYVNETRALLPIKKSNRFF